MGWRCLCVEVWCLETTPPRVASKTETKILLLKRLLLACFSTLLRQKPTTTLGDRLSVTRLSVTRLTHLTPPAAGRPYGVLRGLWHPYFSAVRHFSVLRGLWQPYPCPFAAFSPPPPFLPRLRQSCLRVSRYWDLFCSEPTKWHASLLRGGTWSTSGERLVQHGLCRSRALRCRFQASSKEWHFFCESHLTWARKDRWKVHEVQLSRYWGCTTHVLALPSSFPEPSAQLVVPAAAKKWTTSHPFAFRRRVLAKPSYWRESVVGPSPRHGDCARRDHSLFICLFCGTQGVAVYDHVDLRGYVDCSIPSPELCPLNFIGFVEGCII